MNGNLPVYAFTFRSSERFGSALDFVPESGNHPTSSVSLALSNRHRDPRERQRRVGWKSSLYKRVALRRFRKCPIFSLGLNNKAEPAAIKHFSVVRRIDECFTMVRAIGMRGIAPVTHDDTIWLNDSEEPAVVQ